MKPVADVVIVGGGCMGTSVAYHLARRGIRDVVLVEREAALGAGSTGRNAGGVRHQFSHQSNIRLSLESIQAFERFEEEVGVPLDFHQDGYLFLLTAEAAVETFRRNVELQRRLGVEVEWLTPDEAAARAPGIVVDDVLAATFCGRDGIADPGGVTNGFARAAQRMGVEIVRQTEVTRLRIEHGRVSGVETERGPIAAPVVVNAMGPYASRLGGTHGLVVPVEPVRRHIFIAGVDERRRAAWQVPHDRIMVIDFETTFYFHREGAGVLFGMGDPDERASFETTVNWEFLERLGPVAWKRLPALQEADVTHAWAGLYEMTPDAMPIVGPVGALPGLYLITGFSGHGFQHSPAAGRILAGMIAGDETPDFDLSVFSYERFERGRLQAERNVV